MPRSPRHSRSALLAASAPARDVNPLLGIDTYYRSADLLARQAAKYRRAGDEHQLYVMLLRLVSLYVETLPNHRDYNANSAKAQKLGKAVKEQHFQELEKLKRSMNEREAAGENAWESRASARPSDTHLLTSSALPQVDWGQLGQTHNAQPAYQGRDMHAPVQQFAQPAHPQATISAPAYSADLGAQLDLLSGGLWDSATAPPGQPGVSQEAMERHALLPMPSPSSRFSRRDSQGGAAMGPMYPALDSKPLAPIQYGSSPHGSSSSASLIDADSQPRQPLQQPSPSLELQLGPQQMQVQHMRPPDHPPPPGDSCACQPQPNGATPAVRPAAPPPPALEPPVSQRDSPGGVAKKPNEMRDVHISLALMEEFLKYAVRNTSRGVETCGVLAGQLDEKSGLFKICTLILPKQTGTSDTVETLNEEEVFDLQDKRDLFSMGWIHTHPTQTCFLSSVDIHTQYGYQVMMEEAIAIVMAPRDSTKRCGVFRLTTPGGLKLIQNCRKSGFHSHPPTHTGQPMYELCGHVYLNPRLNHDVVDLR
ncbi:hypothetical protein WJX84_002248 [Apatococcus fuscideae]|uniref:MPN domain-containing protein n=1 Tax=Apatococcus fuscideae TaxID=2026836 RepID=A0AAW1TLH3_9CHLO